MRNKPWLMPIAVLAALGLAACDNGGMQTEDNQQAATEQEQESERETRTASRDDQQQQGMQTQDTQTRDTSSMMAGSQQSGQNGEDIRAVSVEQSQEYGQYLANEEGRAVYVYFADSEGQSNCTDRCAEMWPPVLAESGQPQVDDPSIDQSKLGTIQREDGRQQVTYDGQPLYYYAEDRGPGEASGQGVNNQWALLSADGEPVRSQQRGAAQR